MGYYLLGRIECYSPDNTPTLKYVESFGNAFSLKEVLDMAQEYWPDLSREELYKRVLVGHQKIHTRCLRYDQYDPNDYDDFLVLELLDL